MATFIEDVATRGGVAGGYGGDGLGGGLLGGVILGALLGGNRGGLFGGGAATETGVSGLNNIQAAIDTTAILSNLADIKGSVPLAACETQAAVSAAQNDINTQTLNQTLNLNQLLFNGFSSLDKSLCTNFALVARDIAAVDTNVDRQSAAIQVAISADGAKTRELINSNRIQDLERQLTVAELRGTEDRANFGRERDRISIEQTVNQNQMQAQLQQQQQQNRLDQLLALVLDNTQIARATNQQLIIGNAGAVTGGPQTANPTNVRA